MSRCPICKSPTQRAFRPFCSKRCADIDLGRWMTESYSAPAVEEDDVDPAEAEALEAMREKGQAGPSGSLH